MTVLSLLNPFGWLGWGGPAKLSGGNQPSGGDPMSYAGKPVTPERALELAAYWACVKLIAQTIGTLSCRLYTQSADGSRAPAVDNPLYDLLLHQPNADHSAVEFWEGVGGCLGIWGNSFALKSKIGGRLVALELLRPWHMQVLRDVDGTPVYRYNDPIHGLQEYGPDDLFVTRGFGLCDLTGFAPIQFARQTLGSAIAADEAAGSVFRNGMRTSGWFKYKGGNGILNAQQQEDTRAALIKPYIGSENTGKVGLLPGDFDWLATAMNPVDAELLNNRRMNVEEICRFFCVPPILVGHSAQGQTMWGTGVNSIVLGWMTTGLRPYLKRIEAAIARDIIGRTDRQTLIVAFDTTELTRGDNKGQSEIDQSLANTGIKTRNEIRAERNLPPMAGGDTLTVQSALLPIDELGKVAQLPSDKPIDPGADVVAEAEAKRVVGLVAAALKYSDNQPRDAHGRWASGGGAAQSGPLLSNKTLIKFGTFVLSAAAVSALVATSKAKPFKIATNTVSHAAHRAFHAASLTTPLSDAEKKSIHNYTAYDYAGVNKRLRLGQKPNDQINNIDAALAKSSLSEDSVVYRGLNADRSKRILQTPPGQMFMDRGYPSTSSNEGIARSFAKTVGGVPTTDASKHGYVFSINVDKGANALPLHPDDVRHADEFEVLLPRSSAFKMLSVDHETKTVYAQHVGTVYEHKVISKAPSDASPEYAGDADKMLWSDDDLEWFEMAPGDTTAEDYAGYRPPQPRSGKAFDPSESRDNHGEWTGDGSGSGSSPDWTAAKDASFAVAKGIAVTAAIGIGVAIAPELFAVGGSAAAIEAGTIGSMSWVTSIAETQADSAFFDAAMTSGKVILQQLGVDPAKIGDRLKSVIGTKKAAKSKVNAQLKAGLVAVADHTRDEMISHLDLHRIPADKLNAARAAIKAACTKFKAKLA